MATLLRIQNTVRNITGRKSTNQLSTAQLNNFIDDFYLYDFPERLKTLQLEGWFRFMTEPNVSRYPLAGSFSSGRPRDPAVIPAPDPGSAIQEDTILRDDIYYLNQPAYIDGYEVSFLQDPEIFYRYWPDLKFIETLTTGDGTDGPYAVTMTQLPAQRGSVIVSAADQSSRDDAAGATGGWLATDFAGTVNYVTGVISVTFPNAVPTGTDIDLHYYPYVASRPRTALFFEQFFELRPIPDRSYEFRVKSLRRPTAMAAITDPPEFVEWCNLIAYGSTLKVFIEDGDWDEYNKLYPIFKEQKNLAQRRALKQLRDQRVSTPYDAFQGGQSSFWPINPVV